HRSAVEAVTGQQRGENVAQEVRRMHGAKRAIALADRRTEGVDDDNVGHECSLQYRAARRCWLQGTSRSTDGSFGRPSTRSAMMFCCTSSVPPRMDMDGPVRKSAYPG